MTKVLFYSPDIKNDIITLSGDESAHCIRVLRLKKNDIINLTDGKGNLYEATLLDEDIKGCAVKISASKNLISNNLKSKIHIAVAPTKNIARFEWFLEKSTEIGIDAISPLICEHSERTKINDVRLNKIIVSALKQSFNTYLPTLNPAINIKDFIKNSVSSFQLPASNFQLFIAVCDDTLLPTPHSPLPTLKTIYTKAKDCVILIGPEGDFSKTEIQLAIDNGFIPVSLSENRLRTETAALMACTIINILND